MQALRQIEATIDSVVNVLSNSIPGFVTASSSTSDPQVGSWSSVLFSLLVIEPELRIKV